MYEFFKSDVYIKLISGLQFLDEFYNGNTNNPFKNINPIKYTNGLEWTKLSQFDLYDFIEELSKISIITPEKDKPGFVDFFNEVRENVLLRISKIPPKESAREYFIEQYKIFRINEEKVWKRFGHDSLPDETFQALDNAGNIVELSYTYSQLIDMWSHGKEVSKIKNEENSLSRLCSYFETSRVFINSKNEYNGVDLLKWNKNIDSNLVANELINNGYIGSMFKRTFIKLIQGKTSFEPLPWKGNLSELNKFIKALFSLNPKSIETNTIEWRSLSKIFLINDIFPDPDKLKGASNSKIGSSQELQPFYSYCKKALISN